MLAAGLLLAAVPLGGCCTTVLCSAPVREEADEDCTADAIDAVGWRVLLTPFAATVDLVTLPLQLVVVALVWPRG